MLVRRKKRPQGMEPRIVANLENRAVDFVEVHDGGAHRVRAVDHRAQLEHFEAPAVHADSFLREKRRAAGYRRDGKRSERNERSGKD